MYRQGRTAAAELKNRAGLGAGGMGEVCKAKDTRLGRTVEIKTLLAEKVGDAERSRRFLQEARATLALNHPNIVTIYDLLEDGGFHYIVMERVAGRPLDQLIPAGGMRLEQAPRIATPIADAIAKAHGTGIVHRDLKPSNVMLGEEGAVQVLDFGLAKFFAREAELNATVTAVESQTIGQVIAIDPECAEAYAMKASLLWSAYTLGMEPPRSILAEAAGAAHKSLLLEPRHPLALACSGLTGAALEWNWPEFERLMQQAYPLAPDHLEVASHYAF